jgi:hypothetical protein
MVGLQKNATLAQSSDAGRTINAMVNFRRHDFMSVPLGGTRGLAAGVLDGAHNIARGDQCQQFCSGDAQPRSGWIE